MSRSHQGPACFVALALAGALLGGCPVSKVTDHRPAARTCILLGTGGDEPAGQALVDAITQQTQFLEVGSTIQILASNPEPGLPPVGIWQAAVPRGLSQSERTKRLQQLSDDTCAALHGAPPVPNAPLLLRDLHAAFVQQNDVPCRAFASGSLRRVAAELRTLPKDGSAARGLEKLNSPPKRLTLFLQNDLPYEDRDSPQKVLDALRRLLAGWGVSKPEIVLTPAGRAAAPPDEGSRAGFFPAVGTVASQNAHLTVSNKTPSADTLTLTRRDASGMPLVAPLRPGASTVLMVPPGLYAVELKSGDRLFPTIVQRGRFQPGRVYAANYGIGGSGPPLRFGDPE